MVECEILVVWVVVKGLFCNKFILVLVVFIISLIVFWLIMFLLLIGGLFFCFEGVEKIFEKWLYLEFK